MSCVDGALKMHITYGGLMAYKKKKFSYSGGVSVRDLLIDPDLLTWSIFEDFIKDRGIKNKVEQVWYKLISEDISTARSIYKNKDVEIRKLCEETKGIGEVDLYIDYGVDCSERSEDEEKSEDEEQSEDENREKLGNVEETIQNETREEEEKAANDGEQSEDEDQILSEGATDARFKNLLSQAEQNETTQPIQPPPAYDEFGSDSESEDERPLQADEYPDSPVDTDEEWANFHKEDRRERRKKKGNCQRSRADYDKAPYLWLMQTFNNGDEFRDQLLRYVLKTQYDVKLNRWESTKQAAVCTHYKCKWRIYCSVEKPMHKWMVKVYEDIHCRLPTGRVRMLKQGTIAKLFKEEARRRPEIRSTDIKDELMHQYNVSVSIYKCRKARRIALDMVLETQKQQFAKLWDYEVELKRSNKNCNTEIVTVDKDGKQVFDRFYVCFETLRTTWKKYCRPLIGLDGAFLKWELKGEILAAVGRDAENRIYPIAWAVVRGENKDSWEWFVRKLQIDLSLGSGDGFSFISDRQKGLEIALATVLPGAEHRNCARHVYGNWKKTYSNDDYRPFFWKVAYSRTVPEYDFHMDELRAFDREAHDDLKAADPSSWCRAFFSTTAKSDNVCNNLSESFNRTIRKARELPLINMLETIRRQAMMRIARRWEKANRCQLDFPKKVADILEANRESSNRCSIVKSCDNLFEVDLYGCSYEVSLRLKHCVCREWDLTGIPCTHAVRVINDSYQDPSNYVDYYYKTTVWIETYKDNIKPVNGEKFWTKTGKEPIGVPSFRKMPGRPKKKRIKAAHESPSKPNRVTRDGRTITCGNCKQVGHNQLTCKNAAYVVQGPKRKRGRPCKISAEGETNPKRPRRQKKTQSQSSIHTPIVTSSCPSTSAATEASTRPSSTATEALTRPPSAGRGRGRGRGRPPGRGQARREVVPRGHGVYISPFTNRVFEVYGDKSRVID